MPAPVALDHWTSSFLAQQASHAAAFLRPSPAVRPRGPPSNRHQNLLGSSDGPPGEGGSGPLWRPSPPNSHREEHRDATAGCPLTRFGSSMKQRQAGASGATAQKNAAGMRSCGPQTLKKKQTQIIKYTKNRSIDNAHASPPLKRVCAPVSCTRRSAVASAATRRKRTLLRKCCSPGLL